MKAELPVARLSGWCSWCKLVSLPPQGHFVRMLGTIGDKETENEVLLLEHDIPHHKWSEAVLDCLPKLPWVITEEVLHIHCGLHGIQYHPPKLYICFVFIHLFRHCCVWSFFRTKRGELICGTWTSAVLTHPAVQTSTTHCTVVNWKMATTK